MIYTTKARIEKKKTKNFQTTIYTSCKLDEAKLQFRLILYIYQLLILFTLIYSIYTLSRCFEKISQNKA